MTSLGYSSIGSGPFRRRALSESESECSSSEEDEFDEDELGEP